MKRIILLSTFISSFAFGQVGINTVNPQGVFHIDGAKNNPASGVPNTAQQADDFTVKANTGLGGGTVSVGIGTTAPTESLDVASGHVRIREIQLGTGSDQLVAVTPTGILRRAGGEVFSVEDTGNRVLDAKGGPDLTADTWVDSMWNFLKLPEVYDPLNAYDPNTGIFKVPKDGLYYIYGVCGFNTPSAGSGVFDGTAGNAFSSIRVDGEEGRVATTNITIYRGTRNPGKEANLFFAVSNATIWLKAGQQVSFQFLTFGASNMVATLGDLKISGQFSRFIVNKIL